ncbi:hypothetical protein FHR72_001119 [Mycolicibacterium iranicum]|uniref:Uncharacterized protein n=1 Tax=Mycolicibacterium iranicum TaxID=912594 RepID=A0A839Q602_MYCIR|nr:hypothetical protein [Mycolicibacterium iranicum]
MGAAEHRTPEGQDHCAGGALNLQLTTRHLYPENEVFWIDEFKGPLRPRLNP